MCQLFETIKVIDGKIYNLSYHQQRTAKHSNVKLSTYINDYVTIPHKGVHKLRIAYQATYVSNHTIEPYTPKKIESLKIIFDDNIDYHQKLSDRTNIDNLMVYKAECDDILIIKNGEVTDISFANILFFDGQKWVTPITPLLEGTCRARLIAKNTITPQKIIVEDLKLFSKFMIINAMLDFDTQRAVAYHFDGEKIVIKT